MAARSSSLRNGSVSRDTGSAIILKRRQREEFLTSFTSSVKDMGRLNARAEWESSVNDKGERKEVERVVQTLKNQHESQLHTRRLRLAELYKNEMEEWRNMCLANAETPEDRKQKMIQRALALKERRESERRAIVEEKRRQQYRESCDDCRVADSKKVQQLVLNDREKQLEEKKVLDEQDREFEAKMAQLWVNDRLKKEERDRIDAEMVLKRNEEMKKILDLQVDLVHKKKTELDERRRKEDEEQLREWERLKQVEEDLAKKRREKEIQRTLDVKIFNHERVEATRFIAERERLYDQHLLEEALKLEAETQKREKEIQDKCRQDQLDYQAMLKRQMEREAHDLSSLDQMRKEMEDHIWAKREAQHTAEEAARQELLRQVLLSRDHQIEAKRRNKAETRKQEALYMDEMKRDAEEALQQELRDHEARRNEIKRTQSDLMRQQEEKRVADQHKKQTDYLELKRMQLAEKQHKERIQHFATQMPTTNFRRKAAQWYFDA